MGQRGSQHDSDEIAYQTVSLPLGERGLDLRRPSDPGVLTELTNAQFEDARTIRRRIGHTGQLIQDRSLFTNEYAYQNRWVYGHGTVILPAGNVQQETVHHPISCQGRGVFEFGDAKVIWTGDRLLVEAVDQPFYGADTFWARGETTPLNYGIPAYLPVQTDEQAPAKVDGTSMDICYTPTLKVIAYANVNSAGVDLVVINRETGVVIDRANVGNGEAKNVRVVNSGGSPLALWVDDDGFMWSGWSGVAWSAAALIDGNGINFDAYQLSDGVQLIWIVPEVPAVSDAKLFAGRFSKLQAIDQPHPFATQLFVDSFLPDTETQGKIAIAVAPNGDIAYTWVDVDGKLRAFSDQASLSVELDAVIQLGVDTSWDHAADDVALTIEYRGLKSAGGRYNYVVHGKRADHTYIWEVQQAIVGAGGPPTQDWTVFNGRLLSKSFRVGDEVFAWLYSVNSQTAFLCAGVTSPEVCGIADREVVEVRQDSDSNYTLRSVSPDPNADYTYVWLRPYNDGEYFHKGDVLIGVMDFMPRLSVAGFGRSMYLAGSHCRMWDGQELGDAGFHDYPSVVSATSVNGAGSVDDGDHSIRIYAVRYNNQGERIQGAGITYGPVTVAGAEDTIDVVANSLPITNHDDVIYEFYMTPVGSTVFRYAGTAANTLVGATVSFSITASDVELEAAPADPHAPGVDGLQELEEFGPIGCRVLISSGDRLWGIGGQVQPGCVQFSKLYEVNEGAGFDALASIQIMDAEGRKLNALAGYGDTTIVAFQNNKFYALNGSGPNNFGVGTFDVPDLRINDGATNQEGIVVLPIGIAFWTATGPRLLRTDFRVDNISEAVVPLTQTLTPTGVRFNLQTNEVIWYTEEGIGVLWSYSTGIPRWAKWTGVPAAGVSANRVVTPDGELWTPDSTPRDAGRRFTFKFTTGNVRAEEVIQGGVKIRKFGLVGRYNGEHRPWFWVYYNDSPMWSERLRWTPVESTWKMKGSEVADLTPAEIDALGTLDKTGGYMFEQKVDRQDCSFIRLSVSDGGDDGFTPWALTFELGAKPGIGRTPVRTYTKD